MNLALPVAATAVAAALALAGPSPTPGAPANPSAEPAARAQPSADPAARAAPAQRLVEMELASVFPLEDAHAGVLVLKQKGRAVLLPIVVGSGEADAVSRRLRKQRSPRPRTHDLLEQTIGALGGRVVRVEIHDASEALYRARVVLERGAQRVELDARPSDSIALALAASAPIFAEQELVEGAGLAPEELERLRASGSPRETEPDQTATLQPEQHM